MEEFRSLLFALITFLSICFLVSGIDELIFDAIYWISYFRNRTGQRLILSEAELTRLAEQRIALIVPCWKEQDVIGKMLDHNIKTIHYKNYDVFVGVYPNDEPTIAAVKEAQKRHANVHMAVCPNPGPTNKADNLNSMYQAIVKHTSSTGQKYDIVIMHDSEDVIHPWSFQLYNTLIPANDMVQTPIFPLALPLKRLTYWTYCDEFAELHTKDMHAREAMGGFVPSAGVGTAFSWHTLQLLGAHFQGRPFAGKTFTEDYGSALRIRVLGMKAKFAELRMQRAGKTEIIATRALFPQVYKSAVRQKSRWSLGIVLQEWARTGWPGDLITRYNLLHDRKSVMMHFVTGLGMATLALGCAYFINEAIFPAVYLYDPHSMESWVRDLLWINSLMLANRLLQRGIACYRVYGLKPALLSAPRMLFGNFINLHAMIRAYQEFFPIFRGKRAMRWEKTNNTFPSASDINLSPPRLGEIVVEQGWLSTQSLEAALAQQQVTNEQLGQILLRAGLRNEQLASALMYQKSGTWPVISAAA